MAINEQDKITMAIEGTNEHNSAKACLRCQDHKKRNRQGLTNCGSCCNRWFRE